MIMESYEDVKDAVTNLAKGIVTAHENEVAAWKRWISEKDARIKKLEATNADLLGALRECVTKLTVTADNIEREIGRFGIDRWEGVPEHLLETIDKSRAAIAAAEGETE